jgi:hypothetical protein
MLSKTYKRKDKPRSVYTRKHYESNDGMLTTVWGPSAWHFLHTISFNYPTRPTCDEKRHYRDLILNMQYVLPCGKCRSNLSKNFAKCPLLWKHMKSRETFSKYVYRLHEVINTMLHKTSGLTYDDVRERYEHFRARCTLSNRENGIALDRRKTCKKLGSDTLSSKNSTQESKIPLGQESKIPLGQESKIPLEKGCTEPIYGEKSKCILKIVPQKSKCDTFQMDKKCIKKLSKR